MGTRIKTNKAKPKRGCKGRAAVIVTLVIVLSGVLMGAEGCNITGKPSNETCEVTARDTASIKVHCKDEGGIERDDTIPAPSDLYPKCQVGTFWDGCKFNN